jgi:hypothetical protein
MEPIKLLKIFLKELNKLPKNIKIKKKKKVIKTNE